MSKTELKSAADIICILDASGSMSSMGEEPVQAMNTFISDQKKVCGDSKFSMYVFNEKCTQVYNEVNLSEVKEYTDYKPCGCTALYDTINKAVGNKLTTDRVKNTVMVIITDGLDNASETKCDQIKKLIKSMEDEHNWQVIYLAANQNAFAVGDTMSVKAQKCSGYEQCRSGDLLCKIRQTSANVSVYRGLSQHVDKPAEINFNSL